MPEKIRNAIRFWEPLRVAYNVALVAMVIAQFFVQLPESRRSLEADIYVQVFVLAVAANVLYCAAYVIDIALQHAGFVERAGRWRWPIWLIGTLFALALAYLMLQGLFVPHAD